MPKRLRRFFLLVLVFISLPITASAQDASRAVLSVPSTGDFPLIHSTLKAFDEQGNFLHGLASGDITVLEDNRPLPVIALAEEQVGAQFALALNLGPAVGIRDSQGISRYDKIRQALIEWGQKQPQASRDDWSLITNENYEAIHLDTIKAWIASLEAFSSDARDATPSFDVLARAIEVAADPTPRAGMGRTVLLVTQPPERAGIAALQSLTALALQENIRISVWVVAAADALASDGSLQLAETAARTGGKLFAFSGEEPFPDLTEYLEPLRYLYTLSYETKVSSGDSHTLAASIRRGEQTILSEPLTFDLRVLPPNPIFVSPPNQIVRSDRSASENSLSATPPFYTPQEQTIEILIEFPDGLPHELARTTLYVNGQLADENITAPFEQFTWDLRPYSQSGEYLLQVEAVDTLGLSGLSIEKTVAITIVQPPQNVIASLARNGPLAAGVLVVLAGSILVLVLVIGGRIRPKGFGRKRPANGNGQQAPARRQHSDPVTQPVPVKQIAGRGRRASWASRLSWPQRRASETPPACLIPLEQKNQGADEAIPLLSSEITLGKDPTLATIVVNDPSVAALHARLIQSPAGAFHLIDEGAAAGTWLNFKLLVKEGADLQHGDILHIGRIGYTFQVGDPQQIPKPSVQILESNL